MSAQDTKSPIALVLGLPGQVHWARALAREFDRPIIGIINWARLNEQLSIEDRRVFSEIYSFPEYYLKNKTRIEMMSRTDLDNAQKAAEQRLQINNGSYITHYDRALKFLPDYTRVRQFQLATLEFVEEFFKKEEPAFMLDGVVTYLQHVLRAGAKKRKIPFLITQTSRLSGHFNLLHDDGKHIGFLETFQSLQNGDENAITPNDREKADALFNEFVNKPVRPAYAINNASGGFQPKKIIKKTRRIMNKNFLAPSTSIRQIDRAFEYEYTPVRTVCRGIRGRYRRTLQEIKKCMDKNPSLNVPFIYLPLHYTPEVSDIYFGTNFDHHAGFVAQLAKHIPSTTQLYVKEHTSMPGNRPTSFYEELNSLYNVKIIHPSVDTFSLIKNSTAVATVTGTAGWEAYLLGKPVIALGNVFYNSLPGVFHAPLDVKFAGNFFEFLHTHHVAIETRKNAYRAFFATCCPGKKGDIGENVTAADIAEQSSQFARGIHEVIRKWGHTMNGQFPSDLIRKTEN